MKHFHHVVLCATILLATDAQGTHADCCTNFTDLENALLESSDNLLKLTTTYFHPDKETPLYVDVHFKFGNSSSDAHYIWSASALYFIAPPPTLVYLSHFYCYVPATRNVNLSLHLPAECAELTNTTDSTAENFLFVLSQRVGHSFLIQTLYTVYVYVITPLGVLLLVEA